MSSKDVKEMLDKSLNERWYAQGFNTTPLLIGSAGGSGIFMKDYLGYGYTKYLYIFKEDYGNMHYFEDDLRRLAKIINKEIEKDPDYFKKIKSVYDGHISDSEKFFALAEKTDLKEMSDEKLMGFVKKASQAVLISVGVAHVIEPFALTTDRKIKQQLSKYIKESHPLNKAFTLLMSPVKKSFVNEQEDHLRLIAKEKDKEKKDKLVEEHIRNFFWIRNGYAGRHKLTKKEVLQEAESMKEKKQIGFAKIVREKENMIKELKLDKGLVLKIKVTEYLIHWQDERKKNILKAVDYLERFVEEAASRFNKDIRFLRYMVPREMRLENLRSKEFYEKLKERRKGCVYLQEKCDEPIISGKDYEEFVSRFSSSKEAEVREINGITASTGTAIGEVRVCTTLDSIKEFKEGEILVASMTRPEYVPAMKKAAAIITDEGGITSHAAIVSRELNIPCIIGTRNATKALNDGDLIEIKGNHGLVIVLERKEEDTNKKQAGG